MNQADINASRRLIAQFEDRADGRHNSTRMRTQTELPAPSYERPNNLPVQLALEPQFNGLLYITEE